MKSLYFTASLLVLCNIMFSQSKDDSQYDRSDRLQHRDGDFYIGITFLHYRNIPDYSSGIALGLSGRVFVSKRFSFDADIVFGRDYMHMGIGLVGLTFGLLGNILCDSIKDWGVPVILVLLAVEHFAYHIPLTNNMEISPHLGLLRYIETKNYGLPERKTEKMNGFVVGLELNHYYQRFLFSPFVEYSHSYVNKFQSVQFGMCLGYNWYSKS